MTLRFNAFRRAKSRLPNSHGDEVSFAAGRSRVFLGMGLLVALVVAGHWLDAGSKEMTWRDAERVRFVERQGTGAQRIAKLALQLQAAPPGSARDRLVWELDQFLVQWDRSYDELRGSAIDSLATHHSRQVEAIFCELGPLQWGLLRSGRELSCAVRTTQSAPVHLDPHVANVLRFERDNLLGIERLAWQYRRDARERIVRAQCYSYIWLTLVVAALASWGWWVLRKPVRQQIDIAGGRLSRPQSELLAAWPTAGAVQAVHR